MSEDFWDTLKLVTQVLKPSLVDLGYCDGITGATLSPLYSLLFELDTYYSKPINGLTETIHKKLHNVFMSRWSAFQDPVHSVVFALDRNFCRRDMDDGVKKAGVSSVFAFFEVSEGVSSGGRFLWSFPS